MTKALLPIGVFDSGVGGLTVLRALREFMPHEPMIYLGDTARLPYGTKSAETVCQYALNACDILVEQGIKCLVVACNTATGVALEAIEAKFPDLPIIGVIRPGAQATVGVVSKDPIVVLATEGTVKGGAYQQVLARLVPHRQVIAWPCQLLVALAEEGWCEGPLVEAIIARLIAPLEAHLQGKRPACFLLGCTHFPVLKPAFEKALPGSVMIDPASKVAEIVYETLLERDELAASRASGGTTRFLATDGIERFARVAKIFLGEQIPIHEVELVSLLFSTQEGEGK